MSKWMDIIDAVLDNVTTDLTNDQIVEYVKDVVGIGTMEINQLQIPVNGYYRSGANGEFSCGSCIVMTSASGGEWNPDSNADALRQFIFDYDGEGEFQYKPDNSNDSSED